MGMLFNAVKNKPGYEEDCVSGRGGSHLDLGLQETDI